MGSIDSRTPFVKVPVKEPHDDPVEIEAVFLELEALNRNLKQLKNYSITPQIQGYPSCITV